MGRVGADSRSTGQESKSDVDLKGEIHMNLYLLEQDVNMDWDTYDSVIVCAESEEEAVKIHPDGEIWGTVYRWDYTWAENPSLVKCRKIGVADKSIEKGVVLASFNAG